MSLKQTDLDENVVFVICAHSDDQIFGPGGTVAKYAKEGKQIYTIIFSYGEGSHPWFQKHYTIKARVKEALSADKFIGGSGVLFLGLQESKFLEQYSARKIHAKMRRLLLKYKPKRIFTHSMDDPLPDHRALHKRLIETLDKIKYPGEVYAFDVWTIFNFKKRHYVQIAVDISDTFKTKVAALRLFKSQAAARFSLTWSVYVKAWINGKKNKVRYAEVFYKIR